MTKVCTSCGVEKPLESFHRAKKYKDGRVSRCKQCALAYHAIWYSTHKGYRVPEIEEWRKRNPTKVAEYTLRSRLKKYGITPEQYYGTLEKQQHQCAICPATMSRADGSDFHVDHDHKTGEFRGLLCNNCNLGIGFLKDDPFILERAAKYLSGVRV